MVHCRIIVGMRVRIDAGIINEYAINWLNWFPNEVFSLMLMLVTKRFEMILKKT